MPSSPLVRIFLGDPKPEQLDLVREYTHGHIIHHEHLTDHDKMFIYNPRARRALRNVTNAPMEHQRLDWKAPDFANLALFACEAFLSASCNLNPSPSQALIQLARDQLEQCRRLVKKLKKEEDPKIVKKLVKKHKEDMSWIPEVLKLLKAIREGNGLRG